MAITQVPSTFDPQEGGWCKGMLRGGGDSLNRKWKSCKVSEFQSFKDSKFQSFELSRFQRFKVSELQNLKNPNFEFHNFKMFRTHLVKHVQVLRLSDFPKQTIFFENDLDVFLDHSEYPGVSKEY